MGKRKARALAVSIGLGLCLALVAAAPATAAPGAIEGFVGEPTENEGQAEIEVCAIPATEADPDGACVSTEDGSGLGPRGHYEIAGLEPGNYKLKFTPPPESQYLYQYYQGKVRLQGANVVEVESGGIAANKNAVLQIGGRVAGRVTDTTGVALGEVEVCVFSPLAPEFGRHCTETVPNGKYEILGLQTSTYVAEFSADPVRNFFLQFFDLAWSLEEAKEFLVIAGEETPDIDAELQAGIVLEGRVTEAGTEAPLAGIRVCTFDAETGEEEGCVLSGEGGGYEFSGLFPWGYVVGFSVAQPGVPGEEDGFARQYYEDKVNYAEADVIEAFEPGIYQDIDAHLIRGPEIVPVIPTPTTPVDPSPEDPSSENPSPAGSSPTPVAATPTPVQAPTRPLVCPKGKRKKMVKGKRRCVRVQKRHRKHLAKRAVPGAIGR